MHLVPPNRLLRGRSAGGVAVLFLAMFVVCRDVPQRGWTHCTVLIDTFADATDADRVVEQSVAGACRLPLERSKPASGVRRCRCLV
jgi:hypothetical protein